MFLVAGTFFPITTLPPVLRTIALLQPAVSLRQRWCATSRSGPFGPWDLISAAVLIAFAFIMWRLAIWRLESRLID